jgi:hypothetical protein
MSADTVATHLRAENLDDLAVEWEALKAEQARGQWANRYVPDMTIRAGSTTGKTRQLHPRQHDQLRVDLPPDGRIRWRFNGSTWAPAAPMGPARREPHPSVALALLGAL